MKRRLLAMAVLFLTLVPSVSQAVPQTNAPQAASFPLWAISFSGTFTHHQKFETDSGYEIHDFRYEVRYSGSQIVNSEGLLEWGPPSSFSVTYQRDDFQDGGKCYQGPQYWMRSHWEIIDPARYVGQPETDPYFFPAYTPYRQKGADGRWRIQNPIGTLNARQRPFTVRRVIKGQACDGPIDTVYEGQESGFWPLFGFSRIEELESDRADATYSGHSRIVRDIKDADGNINGTEISEATIHMWPLGGCAGLSAPIDGSDSRINLLELHVTAEPANIPPSEKSTLSIKATCEGVAVKNARLKVEVMPKPQSGGHMHDNAAYPRPRGYLNRTKITAEAPSIEVTTDSEGMAKVRFDPGKDARDQWRPISGEYDVKATSVRFPGSESKPQTVVVEEKGWSELPASSGGNYFNGRGAVGLARHPEGSWGRPSTLSAISSLADDFEAAQIQHNITLTSTKHTAWPIVQLSVDLRTVETNMVFVSTRPSGRRASEVARLFCEAGALCLAESPWKVRFVTHLDVGDADVAEAGELVARTMAAIA